MSLSSRARPRAPLRGLASGERVLPPEVGHYLVRVLRLREGDGFIAFDPEAAVESEGVVQRVDGRDVFATLAAPQPSADRARARRAVTWIHGLAKGDKCDAIVRDGTELGVTRLAFAETARSVVRLDGPRARGKEERWTRIAEEAARQSGRADRPEVRPTAPWDVLVAEAGVDASVAASDGTRARALFCLYEHAVDPLGPLLASALVDDAPLVFAAGPEGGLTEEEAQAAVAAGFRLVSLGRRVLRTETVPAAVLGAVVVFDYESFGSETVGPMPTMRS